MFQKSFQTHHLRTLRLDTMMSIKAIYFWIKRSRLEGNYNQATAHSGGNLHLDIYTWTRPGNIPNGGDTATLNCFLLFRGHFMMIFCTTTESCYYTVRAYVNPPRSDFCHNQNQSVSFHWVFFVGRALDDKRRVYHENSVERMCIATFTLQFKNFCKESNYKTKVCFLPFV